MSRPEAPHIRPPHVLVVDDQAVMRAVLCSMLRAEGYRVTEAEDGQGIEARIGPGEVDAVVMDVHMPGRDGIDSTRALRQQFGAMLPIVLVTASEDRQARREGKGAGADDFLTKPVDRVELLVRVRNLITNKRLHDELERERARLHRELEATRRAAVATERLATLGSLAAGVGHEINNIATVAVNLATALEEGYEPGDAETVAELGEQLTGIGRQLMRLGRPSGPTGEPADVLHLARNTLALLRRAMRLYHADVALEVQGTPVLVDVDRIELQQVLINLVGNAADATENVPNARVRVQVAFTPDGMQISVRDNGCGIEAAELDRILEPYFTTKEEGRGTGLGLPVVHQIALGWDGVLDIQSEVGVGTTMTVHVPRCRYLDGTELLVEGASEEAAESAA